jgi:hypothetical protein
MRVLRFQMAGEATETPSGCFTESKIFVVGAGNNLPVVSGMDAAKTHEIML